MNDFWAQRLGQRQAAPPPTPAPTRPWWRPQPVAPVQQVPVQSQQPVQQASVAPVEDPTFSALLTQDEYTTEKAQSAKDTEACPNCGSQNYMRASGHPNSMKQCFECGSNPRFEQMASGITGVKTQGPVRSARVQNPTVEGAPPMGTIFQHI